MPTSVHTLIQALDNRRGALLDELATLSAEDLAAKPEAGGWSILEIVEHLILAERAILQGLPPLAELVVRPRSLKNRCIYPLVVTILKLGIPVKVPSRRMLPTGTVPLAELRGQWDETYRWLRSYVASLPPDGASRAVFQHPVSGPITLTQALRMDRLHLATHLKQIAKLQARRHP